MVGCEALHSWAAMASLQSPSSRMTYLTLTTSPWASNRNGLPASPSSWPARNPGVGQQCCSFCPLGPALREKTVASLYCMKSCFETPTVNQILNVNDQLQSGIISFQRHRPWVYCGGGQRLRKPRVWKTKQRRGTIKKSEKLLKKLTGLPDSKEEVYGVLDAFIAWELEFPLISVKKTLNNLKFQKDWKRIIQISKWMLSKGQGKTLGTYSLLMEALDSEGRLQEAEEIWQKIFEKNLEFVPRALFSQVISMYERHGMHDKLLEVFADMEELGVKPDMYSVNVVARTYKIRGSLDKSEKVLKKYPPPTWEYQYRKGKRVKIRYNQTAEDGADFPEDAGKRMPSPDYDSDEPASSMDVGSAVDAEQHRFDSGIENGYSSNTE